MQFKIQLVSLIALVHIFYTKIFARSRDGGHGKKQKGQSHLNLFSLLSVTAIPASQLALQNTIGAVLFPGRKHLGQVIKAARSSGGLWLHGALPTLLLSSRLLLTPKPPTTECFMESRSQWAANALLSKPGRGHLRTPSTLEKT